MSEGNGQNESLNGENHEGIVALDGMYEDYFLDYASYVILERAVPSIDDGLKPVQRRILFALKQMDDGRFHKVANVIGQTMQYHPHGDAAIGDALVNLGQKDLLIDCQGNWGDNRTGDPSAAPRYIEARLTKFALEVAFNPQTTEWQITYDGRKKEPIDLPMKFPLVLSQGAEGIAVGLSTKILPHNFIELIKASIKVLQGKSFKIFPDFQNGGLIDVSDYKQGKRGGKVKVRARIEQKDKSTLLIKELPYGVTTTSLIDSVLKAVDKGKIKIKKITDNTAADVEIQVDLASGVSPDVTMDALYAFSYCEVSISPNACVIVNNKPHFLSVNDLLKISTEHTKDLLRKELEIRKHELEEKLFFSSLEKIFIEKRIYREIEECETWESVLSTIDLELRKYVAVPSEQPKKSDKRLRLMREITEEDIIRLTEIKIKRISKYNTFKADEQIKKLEEELKQVEYDLAHLTEYAIAYFEELLKKYGKGRERRTEVTTFDTIKARRVVANNAKLYVNYKEGFIGMGLRKDPKAILVSDCSDIDDIISFRRDGKFSVVKISDKTFVGKNILHAAVWRKGDDRMTYNLIYLDGKSGRAMGKRFHVTGVTRERAYDLTKGNPRSRVLYFSAHPNGEAEIVSIFLSPTSKARKKVFEFNFSELEIKGRGAAGNIITPYPVKKIELKYVGSSTLGALQVYMDEVSGRLNTEGRGRLMGAFDTGDDFIVLYKDGSYELAELDLMKKFDLSEIQEIYQYEEGMVVTAVYYEGDRGQTMVKRFEIETQKLNERFSFITEHRQSKLYFATLETDPIVHYSFKENRKSETYELELADFIEVKGWKALGNKLTDRKLIAIKHINSEPIKTKAERKRGNKDKLKPGDEIEFDGQGELF